MTRRVSLLLCALSFASALSARDGRAQDPLGWNAARPLELMQRAQVRRDLPRGDSTLINYTAKASGFVYFYLDRREDDERTLVKVDQVAIDLYWKAPDRTRQHIVGMRDVNRLPNRMYYHLDHLTVVQNGLGDVIKIGDGDEVRDVPHPAAAGADSIYDYRLADSVTLQLGGDQPTVRVYEIQVRPKRTNRSALIGSVFVDRATADIVRMTFTFTPASYVDRRLDYINISLDNGLFAGRHWLPAEQSVEIRRQLPELDFAAGAVIKGRLRISRYAFNQPLSDTIFWGRPVSAAPAAQRQAYPFEEEIYAGVNEEGLAPTAKMEELQALATELVGASRLSGLPAWRLYVPNVSSVVRHNEAEGWYGGVGITYSPSPTLRTDFTGGYAFGAERPEFTAALRPRTNVADLTARAYYNEPRDIGPIASLPGVFNTISSGFDDRDFTDTYFTRGVSLRVVQPRGLRAGVLLRGEEHLPMTAQISRTGTEVLRGSLLELALIAGRTIPEGGGLRWGGDGHLGVARFDAPESGGGLFLRAWGNAEARIASSDTRSTLITRLNAGISGGTFEARQFNFLLGGRETLPGYGYREFETDGFVLLRAEAARTVAYPWLRLRLVGYQLLGITNETEDDIVGLVDAVAKSSAGVGVGLLWDVIRIDFVKGDRWQTIFSVKPDFWDML